MSDQPLEIENMSCAELLEELARLTTERDAVQADVGSADISPDQPTRVDAMERQADRIKKIGELMEAKGC